MKIVQPPDFVIKSKNGTAGFLWDKKFAVRKNADVLKVQKYVDSTVLRLMKPYTPFRNGVLEKSATLSTVIGSGKFIRTHRMRGISTTARFTVLISRLRKTVLLWAISALKDRRNTPQVKCLFILGQSTLLPARCGLNE